MSKDAQEGAGGSYKVGYGKPPRSAQFKKGQSGNPKGRPKKKATTPIPCSPLQPAREAIRAEGQRLITARLGEEIERVSMVQAMIRAMGNTGLKGGVLAQREFIALMREEEEQVLREKRQQFEEWETYVRDTRRQIARGMSTAEQARLVPHPDDVCFDRSTLQIRFVGPVTNEDAARVSYLCDLRDILAELMVFHGEDTSCGAGETGAIRLGIFGTTYFAVLCQLPPRLRILPKIVLERIEQRLMLRSSDWEDLLRAECSELGLPFVRAKKSLPAWRLDELASRLDGNQRRVIEDWFGYQ